MNKNIILLDNLFNKKNLKILIWGFGKTGLSIFNFLKKQNNNYNIFICDKTKNNKYEYIDEYKNNFILEKDIKFENKINYENINYFEIIIPSPGIELNINEKYFEKILTEFDIFYYHEFIKNNSNNKEIITITGSIGKTSTTTIINNIIEDFYKTKIGGNIGIPILDLIENNKENEKLFYVIEASSCQIEYSKLYSSHYIVWTNIHENHLDRHKTFENYLNAKLQLVINSSNILKKLFIDINIINKIINKSEIIKNLINKNIIIPFAKENELNNINNNISSLIILGNDKKIYKLKNNNYEIFLKEIPNVSMPINWLSIIGLIDSLNIKISSDYFKNKKFALPEHRLENFTLKNGITFFNDSKSTIIESTLEAIETLNKEYPEKEKTVIIGGLNKGVDRIEKINFISKKVNNLIFFGGDEKEISILKNNNLIYFEKTLKNAIYKAIKETKENGIVLFSPGGSSFDLFESYEERGRKFKDIVNNEF
jgi:UDP-N-acetylmuramoylalanine--D-glutamate ligase